MVGREFKILNLFTRPIGRFSHPDKTILSTAWGNGSSRQGQYIFPTTPSSNRGLGGGKSTPPHPHSMRASDYIDDFDDRGRQLPKSTSTMVYISHYTNSTSECRRKSKKASDIIFRVFDNFSHVFIIIVQLTHFSFWGVIFWRNLTLLRIWILEVSIQSVPQLDA